MVDLLVSEIVSGTGATWIAGPERRVQGITTDSRAVQAGMGFVCVAGLRVDGNDFAGRAVDAGAALVVMSSTPPDEVRERAVERGCALLVASPALPDGFEVLRVDPDEVTDPCAVAFLLRLADTWRACNPQWVVVGVTGSVGKTTTKDMLAASVRTARRCHATTGNANNLMGMSLTLLGASPEDEVVVAEMGMNHARELTLLSRIARPTLAVLTNVGTSHIGNLGSRAAIAHAKAEIMVGMRGSEETQNGVRPCLVLTDDNDFASLFEQDYCVPQGLEVVRVGTSSTCDVRAQEVTLDEQGRAHFSARFADGATCDVVLPLPGRHAVADALLALAVVERLGIERDVAAEALAHMPQTHMRMEVRSAPGRPRVIDDSYNASPSSIAAALDVLCSLPCEGRRVAVLGEVGELGEESERLHGYIGAYAAAKPLDLLVFVGGGPARWMAEAARTMGFSDDRIELADSAEAALATIGQILSEDDLVLAKGSRMVGLDRFAKGVLA
jgi:UDP-N-acetylmuramoyl-tripeptide--D-alanyl-D-alanine ligase